MRKTIDHVVLLHGYGVSETNLWFPWLRKKIEKLGIAVTVQSMPTPLHPDFKKWMKTGGAMATHWTPQTLVVAHSLGATLALRLLEKKAKRSVHAIILVSPIFASVWSVKPLLEFFDRPINWKKLRASAREFVVVHAKDDSFVPYDHAFRYQESLNAELHVLSKGGHFLSREFPYLYKLVMQHIT